MTKKHFFTLPKIFTILFLCLLTTCLLIITIFSVYLYSLPNCKHDSPANRNLPIYPFLLDINSFNVTVLGPEYLYTGETFTHKGDALPHQSATLLLVNKEGATFLIEYYNRERGKTTQCIWFASKSDFSN